MQRDLFGDEAEDRTSEGEEVTMTDAALGKSASPFRAAKAISDKYAGMSEAPR